MAATAEAGVNPLPTEGDVAQIIVREATAADGPAILGPCSKDVYNGHDYLPKDWPQWIVDPTRRSFVAVDSASGEIAGFESIGDYDSGATKIFQGLRVSPSFRGKGISKILASRLKEEVKTSGARRIRVSMFCQEPDGSPGISYKAHKKQGYVEIARFSATMITFTEAGEFLRASERLALIDASTYAVNVPVGPAWEHAQALGVESNAGTRAFPGRLAFHDWSVSDFTRQTLQYLQISLNYQYFKGPSSIAVAGITNRVSGAHLYITIHGGDSVEEIIGHLPPVLAAFADDSPAALYVLWDAQMYPEVRARLLEIFEGFNFDECYANHTAVLESQVS